MSEETIFQFDPPSPDVQDSAKLQIASGEESEEFLAIPAATLELLNTDLMQTELKVPTAPEIPETEASEKAADKEPPKYPVVDFTPAYNGQEHSITLNSGGLLQYTPHKSRMEVNSSLSQFVVRDTAENANAEDFAFDPVSQKAELHSILNSIQPKSNNTKTDNLSVNDIFISEHLKNPRHFKLHQYIHDIEGDVVSIRNCRRLLGDSSSPVSDECKHMFKTLACIFENLSKRISRVVDVETEFVRNQRDTLKNTVHLSLHKTDSNASSDKFAQRRVQRNVSER